MANYLKQGNQLIVWPVLREVMENDLFQGNIGIRTHHDMTTKELFQACLEAWKVKADGKYKLILIRAEGQSEISLEGTVKEAGIRNGDFLEIVAA